MKVPLKFNFGAPSCVPATSFESAGAVIDSEDIKELLANPDIKYLAEMMNYPGVLFEDPEVMKKIAWAKHFLFDFRIFIYIFLTGVGRRTKSHF